MPPATQTAPSLQSKSGGASVRIDVDSSTGLVSLHLSRSCARPVLTNVVLTGLPLVPEDVAVQQSEDGSLTLSLPGGASVVVTRREGMNAFDVRVLSAEGNEDPVQADFSLEEMGPAFGLGQLLVQHWPLEEGTLELGYACTVFLEESFEWKALRYLTI
jgi:hypothetical protein